MTLDQSLDILLRDAGSHFDPDLVTAFISIAPPLYQQLNSLTDEAIETLLRRKAAQYYDLG